MCCWGVEDREFDNGGLRTPFTSVRGVWPTLLSPWRALVERGLARGTLASNSLFHEPFLSPTLGCSPLTLPAEGSTPRRLQKLRIRKATVDALQEPRLATGSTTLQGGASEWPLFWDWPKKCSWITRCSSQAIANSGGKVDDGAAK